MIQLEGRVIRLELIVRAWQTALAKVGKRLDALEQSQRTTTGPMYGGGGGGEVARGVVTTAIPTGTPAAPSTAGRITVLLWDGSTSSSGRTDVKVCNDMTIAASVATGKVVKVAMIDGDYWLIAAEC